MMEQDTYKKFQCMECGRQYFNPPEKCVCGKSYDPRRPASINKPIMLNFMSNNKRTYKGI